jgi:AraC-like DNA-binding protein
MFDGVHYREHAPPAALAPFVTCFWEIAGGAAAHRVLPDGAMDVIVADGSARVIGPMTRAIVAPSSSSWVAGVRFRPGAAVELLGVAANELRDDSAGARDVWGARGRTLEARAGAAGDVRDALAALERELLSRLSVAHPPDPRLTVAAQVLHAARGELPIPAVAARVGVGERQLERLFEQRVGYSPKVFARVMRVQRAVASLAASPIVRGLTASWARFAVECGYADQAHLIREFRALTGVTPRAYAAERAMSEIDNPPRAALATFRA